MRRIVGTTLATCVLMACPVAAASGDGLPVGSVDAGPGGVTSPAGELRYVALPAGSDTMVMATRRAGGQVRRWLSLQGRFTVPAVALDGSPSGLSADGKTLVLIRPRLDFPQSHTKLTILDAERMRVRDRLTLRGDFSFDAISPDGSQVYLVEYVSRRDPTAYEVRVFDTRTGRLAPGKIVDPREPDEEMRGFPVTRVASPDGRWAYTLYDGAGKHPFVHALDTGEISARCIDLDALAGRKDLLSLRLAVSRSGDELSVMDGPQALAHIDARTFEVTAPRAHEQSASGEPAAAWVVLPASLAGMAAIWLVMRRRRRIAAT